MVNSHIVHILTHDYSEVWFQSRQAELHAFFGKLQSREQSVLLSVHLLIF